MRRLRPLQPEPPNQNWKVRTQQGVWVVRKNAENVPGVDRYIEAKVLRIIEPLNIAPELIAVDPDRGYLITEYLHEPNWSDKDYKNSALQQKLFEALKPIHAIEFHEASVGIKGRMEQYLSLAPNKIKREYETKLKDLLERIEAFGFFEQQRLCHYDLNCSNVIGEDNIKILDWEFAGMAHPILDVAVFHHYHMKNKNVFFLRDNEDKLLFETTLKAVHLMINLWNKIMTQFEVKKC